jgi:DNA-binding NarL/FixJ family response regulator
VVLACRPRLLREGLRSLIERSSALAVVGEAATCEHALALAREHAAPVLLLDTALPPSGAADLVCRLPDGEDAPRVLALSLEPDPSFLEAVAHPQVYGYLTFDEPGQTLLDAVLGSAGGTAGWFSRAVMRRLQLARGPQPSTALSRREREVLRLLADGLSNDDVADALGLSAFTVKRHVSNALTKTNTLSRAAAVAWAFRHGLIE